MSELPGNWQRQQLDEGKIVGHSKENYEIIRLWISITFEDTSFLLLVIFWMEREEIEEEAGELEEDIEDEI